jgi:hypothetical protein
MVMTNHNNVQKVYIHVLYCMDVIENTLTKARRTREKLAEPLTASRGG